MLSRPLKIAAIALSLAMSVLALAAINRAFNPQPEPPGITAFNPQPEPPGRHG